jgi:hypothetical protein
LGCRFFFGKVRTEVDVRFPNLSESSGGKEESKSRIAAKGTIDGYGWLNSLYDVASSGIFTKNNLSPVESTLTTELYEVLTYLSWKSACNDFEVKLNELNKK